MRLARPVLATTAVAVSALTLSTALAATPAPNTVKMPDVVGDANFVNSQLLVANPVPDTATPGSQAGADINSVDLASTFSVPKSKKDKPVCNGFTVTWTLSGPPAANSRFVLEAGTATNDNYFVISYDTAVNTTDFRYGAGSGDDTIDITPAKVEGNKITITVTESDLKTANETLKSVILAPGVRTTVSVQGALFFPVIDKAPAGTDFKICA